MTTTTRTDLYRRSTAAALDADRALDRARKSRGAEREGALSAAETLLRESVAYAQQAGETWMNYEGSAGAETIAELRARAV